MPLRSVQAARYVAPMREGGSLPGLIEGDDGELYIVKLRGAGQGPLALVSEVISGELARTLGLLVPEIILMQLDHLFGRHERDPEIRDLLRASEGSNAGLAFIEGATTFDPAAGDRISAEIASLIVWLDAFTMNVDRTPRNSNLLRSGEDTWLIDHGASLYFHHNWPTADAKIASPFEAIRDHILLPWAGDIAVASARAHKCLSLEVIDRVVHLVPDDWFLTSDFTDAEVQRGKYCDFLQARLAKSSIFEEEVQRARTSGV